MNRQQFLKTMAGGAMAAVSRRAGAQPAQLVAPETVVYKVAKGCEIKADVYRKGEGTGRPSVMWIHGGALMGGSRKSPDRRLFEPFLNLGYVIVSIDYRLAPETKLTAIIDDLQDAYQWMRKDGSRRFGIDRNRISAAGGSAGGYLTLMTGICCEPRPRSLVSYYGYGDIDGPWYSAPDDFYRKQPLVSKEDAMAQVESKPISEPPQNPTRGKFYLYCRQNGLWPMEVAGHDPHREPRFFDFYCPIRNVTKQYPPTMLIHGTADTDVPYQESKDMDAKLTEIGVEHQFITVEGAGHGLAGASAEERDRIAARAVEWVKMHSAG
jgi:acetyl esterase/lipase